MLHIFDVILSVFILIVITYMYVSHVPKEDFIVLIFALSILTMYYISKKSNVHEMFSNTIKTTPPHLAVASTKVSNIQFDEAFSFMDVFQTNTTLYFDAFNIGSYKGSGKRWSNLAQNPPINKKGCVDPKGASRDLIFDVDPSFSKENGFKLGTNSLTGPLSCALGINLSDDFTVSIAFKPDLSDNVQTDIEVLKMFANLTNGGNGMSLVIPAKTIAAVAEGIFTCQMNLVVGNKTFAISTNGKPGMVLQNNVVNVLFLSKDSDNLRVHYITETSSKIYTLLDIKILVAAKDGFSNREFSINSTKNWNVNILNVMVNNVPSTPSRMQYLSSYIIATYRRMTDKNYQRLIDQNAQYESFFKAATECPLDAAACAKCQGVQWNSIDPIISGSDECKLAIDNFVTQECSRNPKSCGPCWNPDDTRYSTDTCIAMRNVLKKPGIIRSEILNSLNETDVINIISNTKYADIIKKNSTQLSTLCQCPSAAPAPQLLTTPTLIAQQQTTGPSTYQRVPINNYYDDGANIVPAGKPIEVQTSTPAPVDLTKESANSVWDTVKAFFTL